MTDIRKTYEKWSEGLDDAVEDVKDRFNDARQKAQDEYDDMKEGRQRDLLDDDM